MDKGPDWGKQGVIAAYIFGIATLVTAILSYVRPPDPAHPVSLNFLSRTIAVPSWLAVLLATAALTYAITTNVKRRKPALPQTDTPAETTPPAAESLKVLQREAIEDLNANHKKKVWIYLRNDGQTCLKLENPDWKSDQDPTIRDSRVRGHIVYRVFNLLIDDAWVPVRKGLNPICLAPGAQCRLWVEPMSTYSLDDLRARCQSSSRIGTLLIKLNGETVDIRV